ncbi:DNAase, partial [Streptomyces sp. SID10244]|nr:DNAase [Streptomyces sp. SID10244]
MSQTPATGDTGTVSDGNPAGRESAETESNKAARKRRRREPPPDPAPLPGLVDAHTHLAACGGRDPDAVRAILDHAESVGVQQVVTVADDMVDARWAMDAAQWDHRAYAAVALHPTHAAELDDDAKAELEQMVADPRVVAVGETGLDYYWPG